MTLPPIVKTIIVKCDPDQAFRYFTDDFSKWWPGATHSVVAFSSDHKESPASCEMEAKRGGRIYERAKNGNEHDWGTILIWEPPSRLSFTWHPGRPEDSAQIVEVTFSPAPIGTRVTLTHMGWEKLGENAEAARNSYDNGWETVFGDCFARYANQ